MSQAREARVAAGIGVELHHPAAFWTGVLLLAGGVLAHLPEFLAAADMDYHMAGMPMSGWMMAGMAAIAAGLALSVYGLLPRLADLAAPRGEVELYAHAMDDGRLSAAHGWLLFVLAMALVVDVMKPATLGFVMPGMRDEYGISVAQLSLFPLTALTGTTIGSVAWGLLADRMGRRAAILLASLFFVATSICGFMPSFEWNLFMCFFMGLSAGGMLPIVYALMAETVPARMRGWLIVLHGGLGTVCGYLVASGLATVFEPVYTWRILWFFGLPTGLIIIALNRWIPESPRFLLQRGDRAAAEATMRRFGIVVERRPAPAADAAPAPRLTLLGLWRPPYVLQSLTILLYGLGWGLVNWGFLTFLPTLLREAGLKVGGASGLLFNASLAAIPGIALVSWLYGRWSSRYTMALFAGLTFGTTSLFALLSPGLAGIGETAIMLLTMAVMVSSTAVISMLSPYAAEVYPTALRGTGSGMAAGASKLGGMIGPPAMALLLSTAATPLVPILAMGLPIGLAAIVLLFSGIETRGRRLEQISDAVGDPPATARTSGE